MPRARLLCHQHTNPASYNCARAGVTGASTAAEGSEAEAAEGPGFGGRMLSTLAQWRPAMTSGCLCSLVNNQMAHTDLSIGLGTR